MPSFCRHNRLLQNCTICAREQNFEVRPVLSSSAPKSMQPREHEPRAGSARAGSARAGSARAGGARAGGRRTPRGASAGTGHGARSSSSRGPGDAVRVRRLARGPEDGYRSPLVPGLKSSEDAERLAVEIAVAAWRLALMEQVAGGAIVEGVPPAWSEIAAPGDASARTELAIGHVLDGPRGIDSGDRRNDVVAGIDAWSARQGSLAQAFNGEPSWSPERRFERLFERLGGVRGLSRDSRYELLTLLGRLGVYELRAARLFLSGENEATWAAKRALGIGELLLLERRAAELAQACAVPLEALDLALHSWGSGVRVTDGLPEDAEPGEALLDRARHALGL